MGLIQRLRFALRHPLLTLECRLPGDGAVRRVACVIALAEASREASGLPSVLDELEEYLGLPRLVVAHNTAVGPDLAATRSNLENPQTPDEIGAFHRHCFEFLYDLALWDMDPEFQSLLSLLHGERGAVCLSLGGGIGTEALLLVAQEDEVWYCDIPDSPVWKFAQWRAQRRNLPMHFTGGVPEGPKFDCIVAFNAFGGLTPTELEVTLRKLAAALKTGGRLHCNNNFHHRPTHPYMFDHLQLWESLAAELSLVEVNEHLYVKETREGTPRTQWTRARVAGKG